AHGSGPAGADLEWRRRWRLGPGARRPGAENGQSKSAPGKMEQMPAAVIHGLIPCHVSLRVQVNAARRSTPLSFTNQLSLSRLNHWLPRMQAPPEVVQAKTKFHPQIAAARLPQADSVFHNAAALAPARGTGSLRNRHWWRSWFAT